MIRWFRLTWHDWAIALWQLALEDATREHDSIARDHAAERIAFHSKAWTRLHNARRGVER